MEVQEVLSIPERISKKYQQATPPPTRVAQASPPAAALVSDSILPPVTPGRSPAKEQVADFLRKKGQDGTPLSEIEIAGMISLLDKASDGTYLLASIVFPRFAHIYTKMP